VIGANVFELPEDGRVSSETPGFRDFLCEEKVEPQIALTEVTYSSSLPTKTIRGLTLDHASSTISPGEG
jgi:hypothetical protein